MNKSAKRKMWEFPWSFRESFIVVGSLLSIGIALELIVPSERMSFPGFPVNLIIVVVYLFYLILSFLFVKNKIIAWMSSVPAAIASISLYTLLVLLMGFIPQGDDKGIFSDMGFNHMQTSKPFILLTIFLLTVLGYTIIKRITQKFTIKNLAFFLNHTGLFVILVAGSLGSGDMMKLQFHINTGEKHRVASYENNLYEMPFSIELKNFSIDEYSPEMMLFDKKTGAPVIEKGEKIPFVVKNGKGKMAEFSYEIVDYLSECYLNESGYFSSDQFGSVQAAYIKITGKNLSAEGWISCGNFMFPEKYLDINDSFVLGMISPKVQKYSSLINISDGNKEISEIVVEVNKPYNYKGWTIYQYGFDNEKGRWSQESVFEIVKDPWLPVIYVGIFMMLIGAFDLLWAGRNIKNKV